MTSRIMFYLAIVYVFFKSLALFVFVVIVIATPWKYVVLSNIFLSGFFLFALFIVYHGFYEMRMLIERFLIEEYKEAEYSMEACNV